MNQAVQALIGRARRFVESRCQFSSNNSNKEHEIKDVFRLSDKTKENRMGVEEFVKCVALSGLPIDPVEAQFLALFYAGHFLKAASNSRNNNNNSSSE